MKMTVEQRERITGVLHDVAEELGATDINALIVWSEPGADGLKVHIWPPKKAEPLYPTTKEKA